MRPAYSWQFDEQHLRPAPQLLPTTISPEWAWGNSTGAGVKVAVVDSGVDAAHPAVGPLAGGVAVEYDPQSANGVRYDEGPHDDLFGHGTGCAGIIRSLAPEAEIYSIRVLGSRLTGKGFVFAAGLRWAIEHGIHVANLSLSTSNRAHFAAFHRLVDTAVHRQIMVVSAMNNWPGRSYPSEFSGVFSVAAHDGRDPYHIDYNPDPPAEWGAPGIDIKVADLNQSNVRATGNSFAAPHITGLIAKILGKHKGLTVFQMKAVLQAIAQSAPQL